LEERGVATDTAGAFRLGFAPDERGALRRALHAKGINDEQLMEGGLVKLAEADEAPRDYFFNRLIFPITDWRGRVVAFGGRALGHSPAKYINSPETPLFHKGRQLYNLSRARQAAHETGELVIAEGYMDVIALSQAGFPAAVAPLGTAITEAQIAQLWRLAAEPILCLDGEASRSASPCCPKARTRTAWCGARGHRPCGRSWTGPSRSPRPCGTARPGRGAWILPSAGPGSPSSCASSPARSATTM
jgi:DNA primase